MEGGATEIKQLVVLVAVQHHLPVERTGKSTGSLSPLSLSLSLPLSCTSVLLHACLYMYGIYRLMEVKGKVSKYCTITLQQY